jgi:hypothetical protein
MGVHNAHPALCGKAILVFLSQHLAKTFNSISFAAAKPGIYEGFPWIVVRHGRIDPVQIDFIEDEVTDVLNFLLAEVTPEVRRILDVSLEVTPTREFRRDIISHAEHGVLKTTITPVKAFSIKRMVAVDSGATAKKILKFVQSAPNLAAGRIMIADVVQSDFDLLAFEPSDEI